MSSHIGGKLDVPAPQVGAVPGARSSFRFAKSILARLTGFPVLGGVQTAEVPEVIIAVGTRVTPRHRVTGGSRPPPVPTERSVRFSRTTLFRRWLTALQELVTPGRGDKALVAISVAAV